MKKLLTVLAIACLPVTAFGAGGAVELDQARNDLSNTASLQRGAKYYMNYCLGCHSLEYVRYKRLAEDLQISESELEQNLMFTADKATEMVTIAMPEQDAENWFGRTPPDLSLVARSRGADWIYTYLRTFYIDESARFGVNNRVLENASMPHVLWPLEGLKRAVYKTEVDDEGEHRVFKEFETVRPGSMTSDQYDRAVRDIVNFLEYVGEPAKLKRESMGFWVLAYIFLFILFTYLLKREFWRDVH